MRARSFLGSAAGAMLMMASTAAHGASVETLATLARGRAALEALVENPDGSFWMTSNFDRAIWRISPRGEVLGRKDLGFYTQVVVRRPGGGLIVTGHRRLPEGIDRMLGGPPPGAPAGGPPAGGGGPPPGPPAGLRMVGLGTLVALVSADGRVERTFEGPEDSFFNGVDPLGGDSYVIADTIGGSLWKLDARKGTLGRWLTDVSIEGPQGKPSFGGANGLKVHKGYVYFTSRGALWRARIGRGGVADGAPVKFANVGGDDFDFGPDDIIYLPTGPALSTVGTDGTVTKLVDIGAAQPTARVTHDGKSVYLLTRGFVPPGGGQPESKLIVVHLDR